MDENRTKEQLIEELRLLRRRIAELELPGTERREPEYEIEQSKQKVTEREEAIESLARFPADNPNPVLRLSRDGLILYANEASKALLCDLGSTVGGYAPQLWRDLTAEVLTNRSNRIVDLELGERRLSFTVVPIVSAGYANWYGSDITERKRAEEALRKSEAFLNALLDAVPIPVFYKDRGGRFLGFNRAFEAFYGTTRAQMIGKTAFDVNPPEIAEIHHAKDAEVFEGGGVQQYETQIRDGLSVLHDAIFTKAAITDSQGTVSGLVGTILDITERKRMEEALRESEERVRKKLEQITSPDVEVEDISLLDLVELEELQQIQDSFALANNVAALITDMEGNPITAPSNFTDVCKMIRNTEKGRKNCMRSDKIIGARAEELKSIVYVECLSCGFVDGCAPIIVGGKQIASWLIGQSNPMRVDRNRIEEYAREIGADVEAMLSAFDRMPHMTLERFERAVDLLWKFAEEISSLGYKNLQLAKDAARRKKAEEERERLIDALNRLTAVMDNTSDLVAISTMDGNIIYINPAGKKMVGRAEEDHTKLVVADYHPPEVAEKILKEYVPVALEKGIWAGETALRRTDGTTIPVSQVIMLIRNEAGEPEALGTIIRDITERKRAEEALRESEERNRTLFETMVQGVLYHNAYGQITAANPAAERILGVTLDQMRGRTTFDPHWKTIHEDGSEFPPETHPLTIALRTGKEVNNVVMGVFNPSCNEYRWININAKPQFNPGERAPWQVYATFEDVTERKRAEEALRQSEEQLRLKLDSLLSPDVEVLDQELSNIIDIPSLHPLMDDFYRLTNLATAIIDLNGKVLEATGWQDICTNFHRVHPEAMRNCVGNDLSLFRSGEPGKCLTCTCKNGLGVMMTPIYIGSKRVANIYAGQFFYEDEETDEEFFVAQAEKYGFDEEQYLAALRRVPRYNRETINTPMRFLTRLATMISNFSSRNIALAKAMIEQKRIAEELSRSEERYRAVYRDNPSMLFTLDVEGTIISVNEFGASQLGYTIDELKGQSVLKVFYEQDKSAVVEQLKKCLQAPRQVHRWQFRKVHKKGNILWVDEFAQAVIGPDGALHVLVVCNDVTEQQKLEAQLRQSQKMEAVGRLAGGVAHDFNNLLTSIIGYSSLVLNRLGDSDPLREDVEQIMKATKRAAGLTGQLLAFSRRQMLQPKVLDLNASIADMTKMLGRLIGEDIELIADLAPDLKRSQADSGQIGQVILNLAINARDAMPHGGRLTIKTDNVTLDEESSQAIPRSRPGKFIRISVTDTGTGMDEDVIEHIFEPFFTTKQEGAGLGLAVAHGIVGQHEGWINVYSEPGRGSTFRVYLPALDVEKGEEVKEEVVPLHRLQGRGERILVVEDEEGVREFAAKALGRNGYVVFEAGSVQEALVVFEKEGGRFHLVFSDVVLPDSTGLQLIEQLLSRDPALPVLLSSGYADQKSQWLLIREKGFRFVRKPYSLADLLQAVREALTAAAVSSGG